MRSPFTRGRGTSCRAGRPAPCCGSFNARRSVQEPPLIVNWVTRSPAATAISWFAGRDLDSGDIEGATRLVTEHGCGFLRTSADRIDILTASGHHKPERLNHAVFRSTRRRGRDSNPRARLPPLLVFKTATIRLNQTAADGVRPRRAPHATHARAADRSREGHFGGSAGVLTGCVAEAEYSRACWFAPTVALRIPLGSGSAADAGRRSLSRRRRARCVRR